MSKVMALAAMAVMATPAAAIVDITKIPAKPFASFSEITKGAELPPKLAYYQNEDVVDRTSATVKTPHVTTSTITVIVRTPKIVAVPVLDSKGNPVYINGVPVTRNKTIIVDVPTVRTTTSTTYTSVKTYYVNVTPKSELFLTDGTSTSRSSPSVKLNFLDPVTHYAPSYLQGDISANLTLVGLSNNAVTISGSNFSQVFDTLSLKFTLPSPIDPQGACASAPCAFNSNLLSLSVTNAILSGVIGSTSYRLQASNPTSTLSYTSDFLNFTNDFNHGVDLSFSAASVPLTVAPAFVTVASPAVTTGARTLANNRARIVGRMSASAVPEPAMWSLFIVSFMMVGVRLRNRSTPTEMTNF